MFLFISDKDLGKDALRNLMKVNNKPHLIVVKDDSDDFMLGFIGEAELLSSLRFCKLNPEKCCFFHL